jgi:hypothetical protein
MNSEINDIRDEKEFKGITFSGFKKTDVHKEYIKSVLSSKIESALFWACELVCAGHFKDLWYLFIYIFTRNIHSGNPKLAVYLDRRFCNFIDIIKNGYDGRELHTRNNLKMRKLVAEITCVLCLSKKKHPYEEIKIQKNDLIEYTEKLVAPKIECECFKNDPKQLFLPYNELIHSLKEGNTINSCYWVSWIVEYDCCCRSKKIKLCAENRNFIKDSKFCHNVVWMIWDAFMYISNDKSPLIITIVKSLLNIFTKRYSFVENKKKIWLLYFAISILTEINDFTINIIDNQEKVDDIIDNIDIIYKQVKENEISPNTDYLFKDIKQSNLEKTIERLEKMELLTNVFVPRL